MADQYFDDTRRALVMRVGNSRLVQRPGRTGIELAASQSMGIGHLARQSVDYHLRTHPQC
jgi:hypothetical protein